MKKWMILCLIKVLAAQLLFGHHRVKTTGIIRGRVTSAETGLPVAGANVLISGTMLGAATDLDGRFDIPNIPLGNQELVITAIGYTRKEMSVQVVAGKTEDLWVSLDETVLMMKGVTVTASRYQQAIHDVPVSLSLVPSKEITERNILSVDQALRYVPGVNTLDGGQISIRGSSGFNWGVGSRVLVLLNGNPIMAGDMRNVNWYAIPTSNIKQIEVMKGSGSALYGSSAMGGVVNIITDEPEEGSHFRLRTFTGFYNRPSHSEWRWSDEQKHFEGTALDLSTHIGGISVHLSSNYHANTGYRENDDRAVFNLMATVGCLINPKLRFDVTSGYANNNGGFFIYWKDLKNPYANGSDPIGYTTRSTLKNTFAYPSFNFVISDRLFLSAKGRYAHSTNEDQLQNKSEEGLIIPDTFRSSEVTTFGMEFQLNYQAHSDGMLVAGADFQNDRVKAIQFGNRRASLASYFIQYDQRFWKMLKVSAGLRYDRERVQEVGNTGELSRKVGLNLSLSEATHFRLSLAEGFRAPAVGERFISTFTSGIRLSPNPELHPEKSRSFEFGLKQALSRNMGLDVAVFHNEYDDLIEPQLDRESNASVVVRFRNIVQARVQGLDCSFHTEWWRQMMTTRVGYTFIDTKDLSPGKEHGEPLKYRSKHTVYVSHDIRLGSLSLGIDFRYLSAIERVDEYHQVFIKDIDATVPTYVTSLRFGVNRDHYSLRFLIDNLFHYNYLISPANMAPPRTATLQLDIHY